MANTYHQLYIHTVIAVKHRTALIQKKWQKNIFGMIGNLINDTGSKTIIVNGVEDHVHCFFGLKPSLSLSKIMQSVKAKSSKRINENEWLQHRFEWQPGFGCFSYGHSQIDKVYRYIQNQQEHHKKIGFREEYLRLLNRFNIDYDEQYIFTEPM